MELKYEDATVEKYFSNLNLIKKDKGADLARQIKKRCDQLKSANNFNIYLSTGLGKPHPLSGDLKGCYGISLTANIRLIVKPEVESLEPELLKECTEVVVEGVMDYHGQKNEWIIP